MSVGAVDSSAASWEAQTIAAAEAYAEEQAAEAARQRQQAEAAAAAGPSDGVDPPPSAHQRALAAFLGPGPQPAGTPTATTTTAPSPNDPVEIDAKQLAQIQAAGVMVTPAGNGKYYLNVATFATTDKPVSEPSSVPLPSYTGNTTTAPSTESPPPAPPEGSAPTEVAKPAEETQRAKQAPKISVSILKPEAKAAVERILNESPTLRKQWAKAKANEWEIELGKRGSGTRADPNDKRIYVDPNDVDKLAGRPASMASLLAHEIGHAATPFKSELPGKDQQEFVDRNVRKDLEHEGAAAFENARARDEILGAGGKDIGIRGGFDPQYIQIYNDYKSRKISEEQAISRMATVYSQEPQDYNGPNGAVRTKEQELTDLYSQRWGETHKE